MDPEGCGTGRFYQLFKVHKSHPEGQLPPGRPIISGNGSITENIKDLIPGIKSYIQDTPDFLRILENEKENGPLPACAITATVDVTGLYTNILKNDGLEAL